MSRKILPAIFVIVFMFVIGTNAKANPITRVASGVKSVAVLTAHVVKKVVDVPVDGGTSLVHHVKSMF